MDGDDARPAWAAWVDALDDALRAADPTLLAIDFDRGDGTALLLPGRHLGDYAWERYDGLRAALEPSGSGFEARAAGGAFADPAALAAFWAKNAPRKRRRRP